MMMNAHPSPLRPIVSASDRFRRQVNWAWRVIWRGKLLILACILLGLVPAIYYLQQAKPRYTAEAKVLIESPENGDSLTDRDRLNFGRSRMTEGVVLTEVEVLSSASLSRRVIAKLRLEDDPEFNPALRPPGMVAEALTWLRAQSWWPEQARKRPDADVSEDARQAIASARIHRLFASRLSVKAQRRAYVITVQFTSESREKAALVANTIADLYVVDRLEAGFEEARRVTSWLNERLEILRRDVAAAETAVENYRTANGLRRRGERQATVNEQQLTELNSKLILARSDMAQKAARLGQVQSLARSRAGYETASDVLQSYLIQRLREQESVIQREISELSKTLGERHPQMVGLRADLAELRRKIAQEVEKVAASLANEVDVASAGVRTMERELERLRRQTDSAGESEIRLRELERDADTSRALYEVFLGRFKRDADYERIQRANARVLATAYIPSAPSYPRSFLILLAAFTLSLVGGVALVFLLDRLDGAVRSSDEAEELTGLPLLAAIPLTRAGRGRPLEELVVQQPRSPLADAVRSLRAALVLRETDRAPNRTGARMVLVTSSVPKEGKSFLSMTLARLFARTDKRVLLIDADVHRPRLHGVLGHDGRRGLAQLLMGEATLQDVLVADPVSGLSFLPAGDAGAAGAELLNGDGMRTLLRDLAGQYDRIIIDSPPALAVSDTRMLASLVDQVIYLVRWNRTPREAVRTGLRILRDSAAPLAGIVLSQVNTNRHARYGYGDYGQYYGRYRGYYGE